MSTLNPKTKPLILLIPGAWHPPRLYLPLLQHLHVALGYDYLCPSRPSTGSSPSQDPETATIDADVAFLRERVLLPLLDEGIGGVVGVEGVEKGGSGTATTTKTEEMQGKKTEGRDVLIVMHSYGGIPGAAMARGLSVLERKKEGKEHGVVGLVFMSAFLAPEGQSLAELVGGKLDSWITVDAENHVSRVLSPHACFYQDVEPASSAPTAEDLLPQSLASFTTPSPAPAWKEDFFEGRKAYIVSEKDQAVPAVGQRAMLGASGVEWDVRELDVGHSAFLNRVQEVGGFIAEWAENWGTM